MKKVNASVFDDGRAATDGRITEGSHHCMPGNNHDTKQIPGIEAFLNNITKHSLTSLHYL